MKHTIISSLLYVMLFTITAALTATNAAAEGEEYFDAGPYKIRVKVNPETIKVGRNQLTLWLLDESGKPLTNATLNAVAVMPAMGSMPAMYAPAEMVETEPGRYEGEFEPSMGGEWPLSIEITTATGSGELSFDLIAGRHSC